MNKNHFLTKIVEIDPPEATWWLAQKRFNTLFFIFTPSVFLAVFLWKTFIQLMSSPHVQKEAKTRAFSRSKSTLAQTWLDLVVCICCSANVRSWSVDWPSKAETIKPECKRLFLERVQHCTITVLGCTFILLECELGRALKVWCV